MLDDWFRTVRLKITFEEFELLPRTVGYKHEYYDGECVLTPRPRNCYAVLDLDAFKEPPAADPYEKVSLRQLAAADWEDLGPLCGYSFHRVPPFGSLSDDEKKQAGQDCMETVRSGKDGPLISEASIVALDDRGDARGALLVVLKPDGYREDPWRHHQWHTPPPADAIEQRLGQAHLDWVFVSSWFAGRGVGSAMLAASVHALRSIGLKTLTSSFLLGNGESMAWHWRNGFELLPNPASMRYLDERLEKKARKAAESEAQRGPTGDVV